MKRILAKKKVTNWSINGNFLLITCMDQSIPKVANYDDSTTVPNNGGHAESNPWSRLPVSLL